MKVLILGADGFIGRHIAFAARAAGHNVIASARRCARLDRMGFATVQVDLTDPKCHRPAFWQPHLRDVDWVINAAGLLIGSETAFRAVHQQAPAALYQAHQGRALFLGAIGTDSDSPFARWRRISEDIAQKHGVTILRAGLVMGDTSYGGTSLARALAALPWMTPLVDGGQQKVNPVHAADLAEVILDLLDRPDTGHVLTIGGPETLTQAELLAELRRWFGLPPARALSLPVWAAMGLGRIGDALRLGPISTTPVKMLAAGALAEPSAGLRPVRGFSAFQWARPAGSQDLWQARLYLLRPLLRIVLAVMWLASGVIGLLTPAEVFLPSVRGWLPDGALIAIARLGGVVDIAIALALLRAWRLRLVAVVQLAMVGSYTIGLTLLAPALWMLPFGGLLKNLPILALLCVHLVLEDER